MANHTEKLRSRKAGKNTSTQLAKRKEGRAGLAKKNIGAAKARAKGGTSTSRMSKTETKIPTLQTQKGTGALGKAVTGKAKSKVKAQKAGRLRREGGTSVDRLKSRVRKEGKTGGRVARIFKSLTGERDLKDKNRASAAAKAKGGTSTDRLKGRSVNSATGGKGTVGGSGVAPRGPVTSGKGGGGGGNPLAAFRRIR